MIRPALVYSLGAFALLSLFPALASAAAIQCYAWADEPTKAIDTPYAPSPAYAFVKNNGQEVSIVRRSKGVYEVTCKGLGSNADGGHVQVTKYGAGPGYCVAAGWDPDGDDLIADVQCYGSSGALKNSRFTFLFIK